MSQNHIAIMQSKSGHVRYTTRNKKSTQTKLVLKKFDPLARKHMTYTEVKKLKSIKKKK